MIITLPSGELRDEHLFKAKLSPEVTYQLFAGHSLRIVRIKGKGNVLVDGEIKGFTDSQKHCIDVLPEQTITSNSEIEISGYYRKPLQTDTLYWISLVSQLDPDAHSFRLTEGENRVYFFRSIPVFIYNEESKTLQIGKDAFNCSFVSDDAFLMAKFLLEVFEHMKTSMGNGLAGYLPHVHDVEV